MPELVFPTGQDIFLEVNGRKLAVVESYRSRSDRDLYPVESLGETEPTAVQSGRIRYTLELNRVFACDSSGESPVNFQTGPPHCLHPLPMEQHHGIRRNQ